MTDAQWELIVDRIERQFGIKDHGCLDLSNGGQLMWYEFSTPSGLLKLERTIQPRVVREEAAYSKRIGAQVAVKPVYHMHETVSFVKLYRWSLERDDWQEISINEWSMPA